MVKCPFCQFDNEDGALFCEQCKSDLAGVEAVQPPPMAAPAMHLPDDVPIAAVLDEPAQMAPIPFAPADIMEAPMPIAPMADFVVAPPPPAPVPVAEGQATAPIISDPTLPIGPPPLAAAPPVSTPAPSGEPIPPPPFGAPATMPSMPVPAPFPPGASPKLVVLRGLKINAEYPIYEGHNFIGRADEKPVDIDLEDQEPADRVWSSRQHALITFENGEMVVEDLNSSNGTFVNRTRVYPGQKRSLTVNDVIQIGTVQMKVRV